jgi:hypothetical protein
MKKISSSIVVLFLLLCTLIISFFIFFNQKEKKGYEVPIIDESGTVTYGSKNWVMSFKMPIGYEIGRYYESADSPTSLTLTIFDPKYKFLNDIVMDEKATVEISLNKAGYGSPIANMISTTPDIYSIVLNPSYDNLTAVMPKYRSQYKPTDVAGIKMMRGKSEVHMGPLHMVQDQVIGFSGNDWIEIKAEAEQNHYNAIKSAEEALNEVISTIVIHPIK